MADPTARAPAPSRPATPGDAAPVPALQADQLVAGYGQMMILRGVSLAVDHGQLAVIVGPNGAGKSTALKAIIGLVPVRQGRVRLAGRDVTGQAPERLVAAGLGFVPQTGNVFATMSVAENLQLGAWPRRADRARRLERVLSLFPALAQRMGALAGELSGGQRQMVAMGRALMAEPTVLLLDEPTAGLSPLVVDQVLERIAAIARTGLAVLMVEQNARHALSIADLGYVLAAGANRHTGPGPALLADAQVRAAFLGG